MTDRILAVEFPSLGIRSNGGGRWELNPLSISDYRPLTILGSPQTNYWLNETKIDLSGYTREDLTVFFRNSFEQTGGRGSISWELGTAGNALKPTDAQIAELIFVTTVPFNDEQLGSAVFQIPGFTGASYPGFDFANVNRTQVIHGTVAEYGPSQFIGSDPLTADGTGRLEYAFTENFSSLEPTAADCLYCYRLIIVDTANTTGGANTNLTLCNMPSKRVLMSITTTEEPTLEYMMRLKRSYELANQV